MVTPLEIAYCESDASVRVTNKTVKPRKRNVKVFFIIFTRGVKPKHQQSANPPRHQPTAIFYFSFSFRLLTFDEHSETESKSEQNASQRSFGNIEKIKSIHNSRKQSIILSNSLNGDFSRKPPIFYY